MLKLNGIQSLGNSIFVLGSVKFHKKSAQKELQEVKDLGSLGIIQTKPVKFIGIPNEESIKNGSFEMKSFHIISEVLLPDWMLLVFALINNISSNWHP